MIAFAAMFGFLMLHLFATGLSSFYRKGELSLWMREHVLHAGIHLATRQLRGTCRWQLHAPNLPAALYPLLRRAGDASFTVEYLEVSPNALATSTQIGGRFVETNTFLLWKERSYSYWIQNDPASKSQIYKELQI